MCALCVSVLREGEGGRGRERETLHSMCVFVCFCVHVRYVGLLRHQTPLSHRQIHFSCTEPLLLRHLLLGRVDLSLLEEEGFCQRVNTVAKNVKENGGAVFEWEDIREQNGVLFLRQVGVLCQFCVRVYSARVLSDHIRVQVIDCWMSHVEVMDKSVREKMVQMISGECEEWLLSPAEKKKEYNMARELLDTCAARVFMQEWAHKVRFRRSASVSKALTACPVSIQN